MNETTIQFPEANTVQIHPIGAGPVSWKAMAQLPLDVERLERERIVSLTSEHKAAQAFDLMRTKLLQDTRENHWRVLGITAPTAGCGKATVAVNLAMSIAKHERLRVGLIDLDLRHPRIGPILGLEARYSTQQFLLGRCLIEDYLVCAADNLAVGASTAKATHAAELLHSPGAAQMLQRLVSELGADVLIYNLPALLDGDDCLGLLPLIERSLLVIGAEFSTIADIDVSERELSHSTKLLGVVLNKCRYDVDANANFLV